MYDDPEAIANLKDGEAVERITREERTTLSVTISDLAARGLSNSGMATTARLDWAARTSERVCRVIYDTWLDLILQRNQGNLSREDIDLIMAKVNACAGAQERNIAQALTSVGSGPTPMPGKEWAVQQGQTRMRSVASNIQRELEIRFREQEALRKEQAPLEVGYRGRGLDRRDVWVGLNDRKITSEPWSSKQSLTEHIRPLFGVNGLVCPKKEKRE